MNATQYQLVLLEDDISVLTAAHANTTMTPGEVGTASVLHGKIMQGHFIIILILHSLK